MEQCETASAQLQIYLNFFKIISSSLPQLGSGDSINLLAETVEK